MEKTTKTKPTTEFAETEVIAISKNTIIVVLAVALFIMTLVALCLGFYRYHRGMNYYGMMRYDKQRAGMMQQNADTLGQFPDVPVTTIQVQPTGEAFEY